MTHLLSHPAAAPSYTLSPLNIPSRDPNPPLHIPVGLMAMRPASYNSFVVTTSDLTSSAL
jgi:hypothetical protein